jgi:hypothetical protein
MAKASLLLDPSYQTWDDELLAVVEGKPGRRGPE